MKRGLLILLIISWSFIVHETKAQGVSDTPQTLEWVERMSERLNAILHDVMLGSESVEVLLKLTECYQIFDAVALTGVYCTEVRAAADAGRWQCDVINFRLEKDMNNFLKRAVEARRQATRMRDAARNCQVNIVQTGSAKIFTPYDVLLNDAQLATMDLADGLATEDLHILSQKVEHAMRLLYDVKHLAGLLENCDQHTKWTDNALMHCQSALLAPNWLEVHKGVKAAMSNIQSMLESPRCN